MYLRGSILILLCVICFTPFAAFATPPAGGWAPGAELEPDCAPGSSVDCTVNNIEIERDSGAPTSSPTGSQAVVYIDESSGDLYTWDGSSWNLVGGSSYQLYVENPVSPPFSSVATGDNALALGWGAEASGDNAMAFGPGALASGDSSFAFGHATASGDTSLAFLGGEASGLNSFVVGNGGSLASAESAIALGKDVSATNSYAFASGYGTTASGVASFAFGTNTTASGENSTAWGLNNTASGDYSTAWGSAGATGSGFGSTAWGYTTAASGALSTAWGYHTTASSLRATAWGSDTDATADMSTAFGSNSLASGENSTAWGNTTTASAAASTAFGFSTLARSYAETALGYFNTDYTPASTVSVDNDDRLLVVGNGADGSNRHDAFTILKSGLVGIGYDNFETTGSSAKLQVNGDVLVDGSDVSINGVNYTFPASDGSSGDYLSTDGSGNLSWVTPDTGFTFDVVSSNMWVPIANSGSSFTSGYENLFIGVAAGEHTTAGYNNSFIGYRAGRANTTGHGITAFGSNAGSGNTIGNDNLFFGSYAGNANSTSSGSIYIGNNSGIVSNAGNNLFLGHYSGNNNTSGAGNIFIGNSAGLGNNTGVNNTLVGFVSDVAAGTVSNSTGIGKEVVLYSDNQFVAGSNNTPMLDVVFGQGDRSTAPSSYTLRGTNGLGTDIGGGTLVLAGGKATGNAAGGDIAFQTSDAGSTGSTLESYSTKMLLNELGNLGIGDSTPDYRLDVENTSTNGIVASFTNSDGTCTLDISDGNLSCASDQNLKKDIEDLGSTLELVRELRPVTYRFKNESETESASMGFIAQEVEGIFPKLVKHQADGTLAVNYGGFITPLIKAVQELDTRVTEIAGTIVETTKNFLGDAGNGLQNLFAKKVHTETLCVGTPDNETCISKDQLDQLLESHTTVSAPGDTPSSDGDTGSGAGDGNEPTLDTPSPEEPVPEDQPEVPSGGAGEIPTPEAS